MTKMNDKTFTLIVNRQELACIHTALLDRVGLHYLPRPGYEWDRLTEEDANTMDALAKITLDLYETDNSH